ncbi:class I SAM-dependent methyltransferase [Planosporangium flavigriseum]|uniref:Trans-aconitate methyltransferase n=1 Tax=Planosporangium flavigriseum TaxID=373681 RepID=A0A8J3LJY3_9ACTN|nr:class I SAM-dependent methyltransferase [Planosporangium flavigriseum]NJC62955.1 class I SAM-dependent methyltransferase [Planosporangium flavigriseum]GIG73177.1 trans-aconitate methyltransferase [Planosporangium flavigriseum]
MTRAFVDWLALREAADAAARAPELVEPVRRHLAGSPRPVIHDLGSGTGSMTRWVAPRLPGPQHWVLYDRDADLLARATAEPIAAADGAPVTVETRQRDITRLTPADLDGAALITASALLDMLTADEVERVVAACAGAGCPALLTLSVIGQVELTPPDPLDAAVADAFNAHQRRTTGGRTLLGPDAADACVGAFRERGVGVVVRSTPWRLGPDQADLAAEWFDGWLGAACEQRPELTGRTKNYAARRRTEIAAGRLGVVVGHHDLLAGCP